MFVRCYCDVCAEAPLRLCGLGSALGPKDLAWGDLWRTWSGNEICGSSGEAFTILQRGYTAYNKHQFLGKVG